MTYDFDYSNWKEEIANAITHGIGLLLSIPALVMLIIFSIDKGSTWHIVSFSIFGASMIILYLFSTLLHSIKPSKIKNLFAILDHAAIYILIAGTYTPLMLVSVRSSLGWTLFGIVWGLALIGIVFKCYFVQRFQIVSTLFYLVMGWLVIIAVKPLYVSLTAEGFLLLLAGGIMYSIGAVFYVWNKLPYNHAIWHLFVLAGSSCMYFCILLYV
ncbi:hemolysin III family protein [Bacillus haikouensis]|uniref:PAQR family membrane homeostasis protein TrhA n=1 Tax=Bacillus haikouensis TaxID=1510468 RepID=UPI001552AA49|nr:hemolysin III family protein [Bacillus haikouensis]NQD65563.1 hemolysin III family protein [Bacillus haikouensis]